MRKNFGPKPYLYPQPVLIIGTYDEDAAWGGISEANQISICLSPGHKTVRNLLKSGAFTVSVADAGHVKECDWFGIASGNTVPDKIARAGFHVSRSEFVDAPLFDELPMALDCKVIDYNPDTCILRGEIVNVNADESVLTGGKIDPAKLRPITFDSVNNAYIVLGGKVGNAFHDGAALK